MNENDSTLLLKECDAGARMGIASIDDVIDSIRDNELRKILHESKKEHEQIKMQLERLLINNNEEGKAPNPMAKSMSWMKTEMKLAMNKSDATVADLITDGCNMGIKSLTRYLNQYRAADDSAKQICRDLIDAEEKLRKNMRDYL